MALLLENIVSVIYVLIIAATILMILTDNQDSAKKIAWIIVIALVPILGFVLYMMFGFNWRRRWYFVKRHARFNDIFEKKASDKTKELLYGKHVEEEIREDYRELARLLSSNNTTVCGDNNVEIITSGQRKLEALTADIEAARHHIHMEYFYFKKDDGSRRIKELLMKKAREGVEVRFIHENIANIEIHAGYYNEMKRAGVEVVKFTNAKVSEMRIGIGAQLNYRDHRKLVVIDGCIGYTGGMNISDDYFYRWRDTHMRITGKAVSSLQYSFMNSFTTAGGSFGDDFGKYFPEHEAMPEGTGKLVQIVPDEPDNQWPIIHMGTVWTVQHSKDYLYIQTPYFVPPEPLLLSLKSAALKGVDVRLMIPQKADSAYMGPANKSYYEECLEAGIRIFEKTGNFIHSKTLVSDDYLSVVGSANMDYRSLEINYEINTYIYDKEIAELNKKIFLHDLESCVEITNEDWAHNPWYSKLLQSLIRLFAPLL